MYSGIWSAQLGALFSLGMVRIGVLLGGCSRIREVRILAGAVKMMNLCAQDHSFSSITFVTAFVCPAGYICLLRRSRGKKDTIP